MPERRRACFAQGNESRRNVPKKSVGQGGARPGFYPVWGSHTPTPAALLAEICYLLVPMNADSESMPSANAPSAESLVSGRTSGGTAAPPAWLWRRRHGLLLGALFWVAYVLADLISLFPNARFGVQPWSPHAALAVALIAHGGVVYAPVVLMAVLTDWLIAPGFHFGFESILAGIGVTATYWGAGFALRRWSRWGTEEIRPRDLNV